MHLTYECVDSLEEITVYCPCATCVGRNSLLRVCVCVGGGGGFSTRVLSSLFADCIETS